MHLRGKKIFQINIKYLKIPPGRRQTSFLFIQRSREVELRATENKYSEWQGGGPEPGYKSSTLTTWPRRLLIITGAKALDW